MNLRVCRTSSSSGYAESVRGSTVPVKPERFSEAMTLPSHLSSRAWRDRLIPQLDEQAWLKDVRSRFLAVSEAFAASCGATPDQMIGRTETAFFAPCHVELFRTDDRRAIAWGRLIVILECTSDVRFRTLKAPVLDDDGGMAGTVGIALPSTPTRLVERRYLELFSLYRAPRALRTPAWLPRVRGNLESAWRAPISVASLACKVDRSPNHVTRAFRKRYGVSPVEYTHRRRVEWTAHAIATSRLPLSVIALEAGFTDQSHMTRIFSRYFGITPGAYRDAMCQACGLEGGAIPAQPLRHR